MRFGQRNAGNTFQRYMDRVISGLDFIFVYLVDIIIASRSEEEHIQHLRILFQRLSDTSLVINSKKCVFGVASVEFLGHPVTAAGTSPMAAHLEAVQRHPRPNIVKELQGFLGTENFYHCFVPSAARILRPLTDILRGSPGPAIALEWSEEMPAAFLAEKAALCKMVSLAHPSATAELALMVDASAEHVGASFPQQAAVGDSWLPLCFSQKNWSWPRPATLRLTGGS
jgi:hypothetical protein